MPQFIKIFTHVVILLIIVSQINAYNVQKCSACEAVAVRIIILDTMVAMQFVLNLFLRPI
jgi:hypothetical protein